MNRSWGILCAILLIFGFLEPANSTSINLEDIAENLVSENSKFNEHASPVLKHSKIKQQRMRHKAQDQNGSSYAAPNVVTNGNFTSGLSAWAIINPR